MARGKLKNPEITRKRLIESHKGQKPWNKGKKTGVIPWNKGKKLGKNPEHSKRMKGKHPWNYKKKLSEKHIEHLRESHTSPEYKGHKQTKEHIQKRLKRREKSSLEIKFEDLIKKLNLPYKFVGNGEVIIARKCPDFVDLTGKKIAIEVFYRKHKELFRGGLEEWKAERIRLFNQEGWEIIFFDETEVNEKEIKEKLNVKTGGN